MNTKYDTYPLEVSYNLTDANIINIKLINPKI